MGKDETEIQVPEEGAGAEPERRGPIVFLASQTEAAQQAREELVALYGEAPLAQAGVIVALGGDGFMLETLHATQHRDVPVYGMNFANQPELQWHYGYQLALCLMIVSMALPYLYFRRKGWL